MSGRSSESSRLVERIRAGDREALVYLFQHYRDRLRRMVELCMDARLQGRVDASDVLQDAFIDVARRVDGYLRNAKLPAYLWLRLIVRERLAIDHRRHLGTKLRDARKSRSTASPCPRPARLLWTPCCSDNSHHRHAQRSVPSRFSRSRKP
jgi:RNA polymerase sigma-70 factor (ECF subfamily)